VSEHRVDVGIVGGTGPEGFGLGVRWAQAGVRVGIGSRSAERAQGASDRIKEQSRSSSVAGNENVFVAGQANVVVVAVPVSALRSTLAPLVEVTRNKIVVSVVAALEFLEGRPKPVLLEAGSAAQEVQKLLPQALVTSGFHTLSAEKLGDLNQTLDEDTIICGDNRDARHATMELARVIQGIRPISGGRLSNSYYPELIVGMLALLNRIHKAHTGFKLVDIG
jgi:8-hydroxy-5-deazaflavin:NADPH oxidoreductase